MNHARNRKLTRGSALRIFVMCWTEIWKSTKKQFCNLKGEKFRETMWDVNNSTCELHTRATDKNNCSTPISVNVEHCSRDYAVVQLCECPVKTTKNSSTRFTISLIIICILNNRFAMNKSYLSLIKRNVKDKQRPGRSAMFLLVLWCDQLLSHCDLMIDKIFKHYNRWQLF